MAFLFISFGAAAAGFRGDRWFSGACKARVRGEGYFCGVSGAGYQGGIPSHDIP